LDQDGAGRTLEEFQRRRDAIRAQVAAHKINHISFFLAAPSAKSFGPRLGLETDNLLLVV
jgi:hypothetical protein